MTRPLLALAVLIAASFAPTPAQAASLTFTVTKTADTVDGSCFPTNCSLRDAVDAANATTDADTIVLPPGHYTLTGAAGENSNASGDLDVIHDVTLTGAGVATTVIDGGLNDRLFDVLGATTKLSLSGVTLTRGKQQFGSAIQTVGAGLSLSGVVLTANSSGGGGSGSGFGTIRVSTGGGALALSLDHVDVIANTDGGGGDSGFGVFNIAAGPGSTFNISDSTFVSNKIGGGNNGSGFGVLDWAPGTGSTLKIERSIFRDNTIGGGGTSAPGFGVIDHHNGSLDLIDSTFADNRVGGGDSSSGFGTIDYLGGAGTTFTVTRSTFSGNQTGGGGSSSTGFGGALDVVAADALAIDNSTFASNSSGGGGSDGSGGAVLTNAPTTITSSTFTGNSANGSGGVGGAISASGTVTAKNSAFAGNSAAGAPNNCRTPLTTQGHNLEDGTSCGLGGGDITGAALLGTLGSYGGPTQTVPLLPGSPAIDHGDGCAPTDQRGLPRPFGAACDIGAYEYAPPIPTTGGATGLTTTSAVLGGQVSPNLRTAAFHFDYGHTTSYGSTTPDQTGGGLGSLPASAKLTGLTPATTYHYRLVASGDNTSLGADRTFTTTLASLSRLKLSPARFPAAPSGGSVAKKKRRKTGTNITYTASDPSITTFRVLKPAAGRRQGKSCRKPSARNRRGKKCTRYITLRGSFSHNDKAGRNKLHFTGRLKRRALKPGKYRLAATPRAGGKNGRTRNVSFKIVP